MRPPHQLFENVAFVASEVAELVAGLGKDLSNQESDEIHRLFEMGLPPITSLNALSVMMGFNPGFIWSLSKRTSRYYRVFQIPKGKGTRQIEAPRVSLKLIQKWLSVHFEKSWHPNKAVHGFVRGKSHITAAKEHVNAEWVISADIANCFPSTTSADVEAALIKLGYRSADSLEILTSLLCYGGRLSQGAPTSPVISNIALDGIDTQLAAFSAQFGIKFTRYADDIVFSGEFEQLEKIGGSESIFDRLKSVFSKTSWSLADHKLSFDDLPRRLKVHGLLVHGDSIRLTKGYRNRIRAYKHLLKIRKIKENDLPKVIGHLNYSKQIDEAAS